MKLLSLYHVELRRLIRSKFTWVIGILSLCGPWFGYSFFHQVYSNSTMSSEYIADPVLAGTVIGAVLWALLTLLESDRIYRAKTDVLLDSIISPVHMLLSRVLALITLSTVTTMVCAVIYLPYTIIKIDYLFNGQLYVISFLILMLPTWWTSILLASALYQITRRLELAGLLYSGCVYFSFSQIMRNNYFARWLNPIVVSYSDGFSNALILRITFYTRVLWLALSAGIWVFSLLCIRQYQKSLPGSFVCGLKRVYLPLISALLLCTGAILWIWQPFINHSQLEWNMKFGPTNSYGPSATHAAYKLAAGTSGVINGTAEYIIDNLGNPEIIIWLDPGYRITAVTYGGKKVEFKTHNTDVNEWRATTFTIPKENGGKLMIHYRGLPQMIRCFLPFSWDNSSSEDYVSLMNGATVPMFTSFTLPGQYDLELTIPEKLMPIVEHQILTDFSQNSNGTKTWSVKDAKGSLGWITACDYANIEFQAAGTTINLLYSKKYDKNVKKYNMPQAITEVMEYCSKHLKSLSFVEDDKLIMIQRASSIGPDGGNAGEGWVEWSEFLFAEKNLSNPLKGAGAAEVFAHEIIHEWWGGLGVICDEDGLWSSEGLDVYTTYRLMKEKYGALYAQQNYIDSWQTAVNKQDREYYNRHPEMLRKLPEKYQVELKYQAENTNKYCRMPLMILKAEQLVGGEENMDKILQDVQKKFKYGRVFTYQDFLDACGLKEGDLDLE